MPTVGENIRTIRRRKRLSQDQLAKIANVAQSTLSDIETGKQNPSVVTIEALASALNCRAGTLLNENAQRYYPDDIPAELHLMMERMTPAELKRVMDFSAGLIAARDIDDENTEEVENYLSYLKP